MFVFCTCRATLGFCRYSLVRPQQARKVLLTSPVCSFFCFVFVATKKKMKTVRRIRGEPWCCTYGEGVCINTRGSSFRYCHGIRGGWGLGGRWGGVRSTCWEWLFSREAGARVLVPAPQAWNILCPHLCIPGGDAPYDRCIALYHLSTATAGDGVCEEGKMKLSPFLVHTGDVVRRG